MGSRGRMLATFALLSLYSGVAIGGSWALFTLGTHSWNEAFLTAACLILSVMLTVLRIPMGGDSAVTIGSIVSFICIPLIGPWPSAGVKFLGTVLGGFLSRKKPLAEFLPAVFSAAGTLTCAALVSGEAFLATGGGPVGIHSVRTIAAPYPVMVVVYLAANIVFFAIHQAVRRSQGFFGAVQEALRHFWFNNLVLALVGLISLVLVAQLRVLGLLVICAGMLAARFSFQLYADNKRVRSEMAGVLAQALRFKDPYTGDHSARVADLSVRVGRILGMTDLQLEKLHDSALLHDIGKIAVPDAVLVKPGPLNPNEWQSMERHVGAGGEILEQSPHLKELAGNVRAHHTDYDATTRAEALPLAARIICVADAFDAMTSDRPYRKALPRDEALRRLREGSGTQFDPAIVNALMRALGEENQPAPPPDRICEATPTGLPTDGKPGPDVFLAEGLLRTPLA